MENSQPLATDSFSYSWLINRKPSIDNLVESLRNSGDSSPEAGNRDIVQLLMHHHKYPSKFLKEEEEDDDQDFDFNIDPLDFSSSSDPPVLVPADEIFSDGCIKPLYANYNNRSKMQFQASTSTPATPISSFPPITLCSAYRSQYYFLRKWSKSSNRMLQKCFALFIRPFCQRFGCSRKSIRVVDLERKVWEVRCENNKDSLRESPEQRPDNYKRAMNVKSWNSSPQVSPQRSPYHSAYARCDIESSIHEAILHCKRSFAQ